MKTLTNKKEIRKSLRNKKILLATWGCKIPTNEECTAWPPIFKKIFKKLIVFSLRNELYYDGKESLNKKFLSIIEKEKPDFLLVCPSYDELETETLINIKKINPKMKTIIWFGDDDFRFDDWSRYYALFFDYIITTKKEIDETYKKDGIKKASFMIGLDSQYHKPLNLKKIYDVTFIGSPIVDRYDYIKFLKNNGVNIKLFGWGWYDYPDLKDIYGGPLSPEDYIKVVNQTKINLNFSKIFFKEGKKGAIKGRLIRFSACNSFVLTEYTNREVDFFVKKSEINFKTKKELLKKIKYYLKHEDERKKLIKEAYDYSLKNHTFEDLFTKYFEKIEGDKIREFKLPKISNKIIKITKNDIDLPLRKLRKKLKDVDYVSFCQHPCMFSAYKDYFQIYSLSVSKKQISCCDYYVYSESLGDYLSFLSKKAFNTLNRKDFYKLLNINQLTVTKDYFLKNLNIFRNFFRGKGNIINEKNTVFVSIPLIKIKNVNSIKYQNMKKAFHMLFFIKIGSIFYTRRLNLYFFKFLIYAEPFMFKYLFDRLFNKADWESIKYLNKT